MCGFCFFLNSPGNLCVTVNFPQLPNRYMTFSASSNQGFPSKNREGQRNVCSCSVNLNTGWPTNRAHSNVWSHKATQGANTRSCVSVSESMQSTLTASPHITIPMTELATLLLHCSPKVFLELSNKCISTLPNLTQTFFSSFHPNCQKCQSPYIQQEEAKIESSLYFPKRWA